MKDEVLQAIHNLRSDLFSDVQHSLSESESRIRNEMLTGFDHVYHRLDRLETEMVALNGGLHRVENRLDALEKRFDVLGARCEEGLGKVAERLTSVERRLEVVERVLEDQHVETRAELDDLKQQTALIRTRLEKIETPRSRS
jgi:predicted nuclease with TOPRIM domain